MNKIFSRINFLRIAQLFFYGFVFCLPFNINVVVYAPEIFGSGNFNPYTSYFIYLCDFLFVAALLSWVIAVLRGQHKEEFTYGNLIVFLLLVAFFIAAEVSILFAQEQLLAILLLVRLAECVLLYFFMVNKVVSAGTVVNVFIASMSLQAFIAILQYLFQGSLGLYFLGESFIAPESVGIAKMTLMQDVFVRPYGTFPHSNILAGFLVISVLFTAYKISNKEYIAYPLLFLQTAALVLTFSRSAFLALIVAWFVYISIKNTKIPYKLIILLLCAFVFFVVAFNLEELLIHRVLFNDISSLNERVFYFNVSKAMLFVMPLGVGLGNFTYIMQSFTNTKLAPWDYQPVHNIYMLIANETGWAGLIVFISLFVVFGFLIFKMMKKAHSEKKKFGVILISSLAAYFVIGLFDHYLFSLYQGLILSFFLFGLCGSYITSENR